MRSRLLNCWLMMSSSRAIRTVYIWGRAARAAQGNWRTGRTARRSGASVAAGQFLDDRSHGIVLVWAIFLLQPRPCAARRQVCVHQLGDSHDHARALQQSHGRFVARMEAMPPPDSHHHRLARAVLIVVVLFLTYGNHVGDLAIK